MRGYYRGTDPAGKTRWAIVDALRRYGTGSTRLTHAFGALHGLQQTDMQALVAIMAAEGVDEPLTPGRLRERLGLSSAGTTYVIDRLEKAGYVQRTQDHPRNRRMVQLRYTDQGMTTAMDFFGPVGERTGAIMDGFTAKELQVVHRFVAAIAESMQAHVAELDADQSAAKAARPKSEKR